MSDRLDAVLRRRLAVLAAHLIPGDGVMPPADAIGLETTIADRILALRPGLTEPLVRALQLSDGDTPATVLPALECDDPDAYAALVTVIAGGYLMAADVKAASGYPEQEERPFGDPGADPDWMTDGMLEAVLERGPIYRKA